MATNAIIAKNYGEGFEGVFHYRDAFPAVLGAELFKKHRTLYRNNTGRMVAALVDKKRDGGEHLFDDARVYGGDHDIDYVYNIDERSGHMQVIKKTQETVLSGVRWVIIANIDLKGKEPDWNKIDAVA